MAKKLPQIQREAWDNADILNQYLQDYMDEIFLSNRGWFHKFKETYKSDRQLQKNIIMQSELTLDGNFDNLGKASKDFSKMIDDLSKKTAILKKENVGLEYPTEFSGMFSSIAKWYTELREPMNQLAEATKMEGGAIVKKTAKVPQEEVKEKEKKDKEQEETNKDARKFYQKFFEFLGLEKAKNAISKTRDETKDTKGRIDKAVSKTGSVIKSVLDNILDLPMVLSGLLGTLIGKFTGLLSSGVALLLVGAKKLITSRFGLVGIATALLLTDGVQDLITKGMKAIFGEEPTNKIVNFFKKYDFESVLTGAGIGLMIAGPIGAIVGGIMGKLVSDIQKINIPEIDKELAVVNDKRKQLQDILSQSIAKIAGIDSEIAKAVAEGDIERVKYLENNRNIALAENERLRVQVRAQENISARMEADKKIIEENGWFGKLFVALSDWGRAFNDLWVSYLTPFENIAELKATTEIKIENMKKWFGEKWKTFTDWVDYIIDLPNMLLDKMNVFLEEKRNWLYDKTNGWLGTPSEEQKQKEAKAGKLGGVIGDAVKNGLAPGEGVMAKNNDKSDYVKYLEKQRETIEETRRQRASALINAPTTNSTQTTVQNNQKTTVSMRPSPIDAMLRNSPSIAW